MRTVTSILRPFLFLLLALPASAGLCRGEEKPSAAPPSRTVLQERLQKAEAAAPAKNARISAIVLPLVKLQLEKAALYGASSWSETGEEKARRAAADALKCLDAGRDPFAGAAGLQERAYLSSADGSAQPYWVYVPKRPAPKGGWPLLVYLHGYVTDTTKINPWLPGPDFWTLAEEKGFLVAVPYGRRNTDFEGIGEQDVLTVLDETKRYYPVDADRVTLCGPSMGGYGVYVVGLHYPDLFAGLAPMCGRSIPYVVEQRYPRNLPAFKRIAAEPDTPLALVENAKHLPIFIQHGEQDQLIDPEHSRRLAARWKELGYAVRYQEWAGHNHYIYWEQAAHAAIFDWAADKRRDPAPREIAYTTFTPKYGRAYWATITGMRQWGKPARLHAVVTAENRIQVTTENVTGYTLTLPQSLAQPGKPLTVITDGQERVHAEWRPGEAIPVQLGTAATGPVKHAACCGPVRECFQSPFILVPGTQGDAAEDARLAGWAQRWAAEWSVFADGVPPIKADTAVTEADIRSHNLVLFGDRSTNAVLARIADRLPVEWTAAGYRLGEKQIQAPGLGLLMTYPNPLALERLVCVNSGIFWGTGLDPNHKFDLAPDFILFKPELDDMDPARTPRSVCAGYFDSRWQLDDSLTWRD